MSRRADLEVRKPVKQQAIDAPASTSAALPPSKNRHAAEPAEIVHDYSTPRPHRDLATEAEAMQVAQDLRDSGTVTGKIQVFQATIGEGLPPVIGEHKPYLISWSDTDPVSVQPVSFRCSAGELIRALLVAPVGVWEKDFDARTLRRRAV